MPLTEAAVRNAKARDRHYKLFDGGGLFLYVRKNGSKLWQMAYRFEGKAKTLSFGPYPVAGLAYARQKRDDAKRLLLEGIDPGEMTQRKLSASKVAARSSKPSFEEVARDCLETLRHDGRAAATLDKFYWLVSRMAAAAFGTKPIDEVEPADILKVMKELERSGKLETAKRFRTNVSRVFQWAIPNLLVTSDPTTILARATKRPKVRHRSALTEEKPVRELFAAVQVYSGSPIVRLCAEFQALTVSRPGEARAAEWKEIDLDAATWSIPAERTKMRKPHVVPLSSGALCVLERLGSLSPKTGYVFPSQRPGRPLSENTLNMMYRLLGYSGDQMTAHGWRSSFSTIMHERGHSSDIIELCLAHEIGSTVRRAYDRSSRMTERSKLLQDWSDFLLTDKTSEQYCGRQAVSASRK